jgi:hypothetical protein
VQGSQTERRLTYQLSAPRLVKLTRLIVEPPLGTEARVVSITTTRYRGPWLLPDIILYKGEDAFVELRVHGKGNPQVMFVGIEDGDHGGD